MVPLERVAGRLESSPDREGTFRVGRVDEDSADRVWRAGCHRAHHLSYDRHHRAPGRPDAALGRGPARAREVLRRGVLGAPLQHLPGSGDEARAAVAEKRRTSSARRTPPFADLPVRPFGPPSSGISLGIVTNRTVRLRGRRCFPRPLIGLLLCRDGTERGRRRFRVARVEEDERRTGTGLAALGGTTLPIISSAAHGARLRADAPASPGGRSLKAPTQGLMGGAAEGPMRYMLPDERSGATALPIHPLTSRDADDGRRPSGGCRVRARLRPFGPRRRRDGGLG